MSWKTVPTTSSPSVSCAEMYAWPWGWGKGEGGEAECVGLRCVFMRLGGAHAGELMRLTLSEEELSVRGSSHTHTQRELVRLG